MPAPRKRSVKAKCWHGHPSDMVRAERVLTEQDRRNLAAAAAFVVVCPVCNSRHAVHRDVVIATLCCEAMDLVHVAGRKGTGYSKSRLWQLPRTIQGGIRKGTVLMWCPCGYEIQEQDIAPLLARFLMTGQQQFLSGGRYGDK